jgi:hypothetical protein
MSLAYQNGYYNGASFNGRWAADTAATNASLKTAPETGSAVYLTDVDVCCGATARVFQLLDGSGGTVIWQVGLAASTSVSHKFKTPIKLTSATALCLTSAGASVGAFVAANGFVDKG